MYNRWGKKVFEASAYQNTWDGAFKNSSKSLAASGSYYYQIDLDGDGSIDQDGWLFITE